jgi:hypothetical protein
LRPVSRRCRAGRGAPAERLQSPHVASRPVTALRQYPQLLAGAALVEGVDLDAAATPLVQ